jgi:hypothetical protein
MTEKELTGIIYEQLYNAGNIEFITVSEKKFSIYQSGDGDKFITCFLNDAGEGSVSSVFSSIEECYQWIEVNK